MARVIVIFISSFIIAFSLHFISQVYRSNFGSYTHLKGQSRSHEPIYLNQTFGFSRIFAINLEHRHDRKEELIQMANYSNLHIELQPGILIKDDSKEFMYKFSLNQVPITRAKMGCYLAHSNIWKKIVKESIPTALIIEDDVDWDIDVKVAMERLQTSLSSFISSETKRQQNSNKDWDDGSWDILRLGTCNDPPRRTEGFEGYEGIEIYHDNTVTDRQSTTFEHVETLDYHGIPLMDSCDDLQQQDAQFRMIKKSHYPVCLHAYAITTQGATKLIELTSKGLLDGANDLTVARLTQRGHLRSFTVIPSIFGQYKILNWHGNSDIVPSATEEVDERRYTYDVRYGVRTNVLKASDQYKKN